MNVRPLTGGITSSVHALDIVDARGVRHPLVMRRYTNLEHTDEHLPMLVTHEAATLAELGTCALGTPSPVAADPTGEHGGVPALLMTRVPGRMLLSPRDPASWSQQIAAALPLIHALRSDTDRVMRAVDAERLEPPIWAHDPGSGTLPSPLHDNRHPSTSRVSCTATTSSSTCSGHASD